PATTHGRELQAMAAIYALQERVALLASPRTPVGRRLVAIEVPGVAEVVRLLDANRDAGAHECGQAAVMRVVGKAQELEARVIFILVAIDLFPAAIWIELEGIIYVVDSFQQRSPAAREAAPGDGCQAAQRQELAPVEMLLHSLVSTRYQLEIAFCAPR